MREDAILRQLDPRIESFADPAWLSEADNELKESRARSGKLHAPLGSSTAKSPLMDAIESGGDQRVLVERLAERNAEREALRIERSSMSGSPRRSPSDIEALIAELGGPHAGLTKGISDRNIGRLRHAQAATRL